MTHDSRTETEGERRFNAITAAYIRAVERGEVPDRDKIVARDPDLADRLRRFFENDDGLNRMLAPLRKAVQTPRVESEVTIGFQPSHPGRVLETLAKSIGSIPRVLLPDTQVNDPGAPLVQPSSTEMPPPGDRADRYQIFGEIAHGGMGAILKGRDTDLGRELAVKVLLERHQDEPEMVRRFVEEAQIGGQLQHPGIVPVYELGTFSDQRPYFTMKLVKGRTLAAILSDRKGISDDLPRLLGIFEQICQTLAYAHARSVIHRDLKPSNIMVGGFGEVQVMDWGLAKVLKPGGAAEEETTAPAAPAVSVIRTVRSGSAPDASRAGSVLGTLAYMPPEQAWGEVEKVDQRADVFGLGSILCELLTGQPAYTGRTADEVRRKAERGDTADALKRLGASQCDPDLVALAKDCLVVEPLDRPRDASIVLERITGYLTGVQEKLRAAELARVEAQARAEEEVKRRELADQLAHAARARAEDEVKRRELADRLVIAADGRAVAEARRRKATLGLAAAVSALALILLAGIGVGAFFVSRLRSAFRATARALSSEQTAHRNEVTARQDEATVRYFNNMLMAEREWANSNVRQVDGLLDDCVPKRGEPDRRHWEWHYLDRQRHSERKTLAIPSNQFFDMDFSPDGGRVVTADIENESGTGSKVWEVETGRLVYTLGGHSGNHGGVAFSRDGTLIASSSGSFDKPGEVKIWDSATGRELKSFSGATWSASRVAFSPDGKCLAAVSGSSNKRGLLTIWDIPTGATLREIENPEGEQALVDLAFSPDGKRLATASGNSDSTSTDTRPGKVIVWDSETGVELLSLIGHEGPLTGVVFSPDGRFLATASEDKTVRIWDATTGEVVRVLRGHTQMATRVAFSPDGSRVASSSNDNSAKVWDATTGQELFTIRGHRREVIVVAYIAGGRYLATAAQDQTVKFWDARMGQEALTIQGHTDRVNSAQFRPDGREIVTASIDKHVRVFNAATGQLLRTFPKQADVVWDVAYSPDGAAIATASGHWKHPETRGEITLWDARARTMAWSEPGRAHAGLARALAFSPDGARLASTGGENHHEPGVVKIWDVKTGREMLTLVGSNQGLNAVQYSPDGRLLASGGFDDSVRIWDANTGRPIHTLNGHFQPVFGVAFSPMGTQVASASWDGTVRLWDLNAGKQVKTLLGHKAGVLSVAFSPDGTRIASGSDDYTVKLWDVATGREALTLRGHKDRVWRVAFSPDGNRICSASQDGTVRIWGHTLGAAARSVLARNSGE